MTTHTAKSSKAGLYVIIAIVIVILLGVGVCFLLTRGETSEVGSMFSKGIKEETITAENYEEMMDKIEEKMKDDEELYYLSYSVMYHIMKDGFTEEYMTTQDDNLLYKNIYNKTVQKLIDEGKQLMKDNNMTIEQYKQQLEEINDITAE